MPKVQTTLTVRTRLHCYLFSQGIVYSYYQNIVTDTFSTTFVFDVLPDG